MYLQLYVGTHTKSNFDFAYFLLSRSRARNQKRIVLQNHKYADEIMTKCQKKNPVGGDGALATACGYVHPNAGRAIVPQHLWNALTTRNDRSRSLRPFFTIVKKRPRLFGHGYRQ